MRILVVDDDDMVQSAVARALRAEGYAVATAGDLESARACIVSGVDLVVLDLRLPDGFGLELCRELRRDGSSAPILLLTALTDVVQRVEGLDAGADDFLAKPFAIAELRARVRALGRRGPSPRGLTITLGDVMLDFGGRRAQRAGKPVSLTGREWSIIEVLARRSGRLVQHSDLLEAVWGEVNEVVADSLAVLIGRLRRKLGWELITTHRGEGYSLGEGAKSGSR
jgi:DNA-binding response OmpR family regulator